MSDSKPEKPTAVKEIPAQIFVTRTFSTKDAGSEGPPEEEILSVHQFVTEPAKVEVSMGLTLNLGNHEFARINVGVVLPCYREELDEAFLYAKAWAEKRVQQEVDEARQAAKKSASEKF